MNQHKASIPLKNWSRTQPIKTNIWRAPIGWKQKSNSNDCNQLMKKWVSLGFFFLLVVHFGMDNGGGKAYIKPWEEAVISFRNTLKKKAKT